MELKYKINIAGLIIRVYIDNQFNDNLINFINKFGSLNNNNFNYDASVHILKGYERKIELSQNWESIFISGNEIDDITNPFNFIGITQAIFRFAAIHLAKRDVFLLHGSASVLNNKIICFGDDGDSIEKTLGSLEVALISNQYVADEFCFFNTKTKRIFGYNFIPIHIRSIVKKHLESIHNIILPKNNYKQTNAGEFIDPNNLFVLTSGELNILSYIHFFDSEIVLEELSFEEAYKSFKFCITSHIVKLLYPKFDRMKFSSMSDATFSEAISEELIDEVVAKISKKQVFLEAIRKFTSYKLIVSEPCQIISLLKYEV